MTYKTTCLQQGFWQSRGLPVYTDEHWRVTTESSSTKVFIHIEVNINTSQNTIDRDQDNSASNNVKCMQDTCKIMLQVRKAKGCESVSFPTYYYSGTWWPYIGQGPNKREWGDYGSKRKNSWSGSEGRRVISTYCFECHLKIDNNSWRWSSIFSTLVTCRGQEHLLYIDSGSTLNGVLHQVK